MTKDEAHREAIKRWQALPAASRKTLDHALDFAKVLDPLLEFETLGNKSRIIEAWLVRELGQITITVDARPMRRPTGPSS